MESVEQLVKTGRKYDTGKQKAGLLFEGPLAYCLSLLVRVLTFGAQKYEAHSWMHVQDAHERYTNALYRHQLARTQGQKIDPESRLPHRVHEIINQMFLLYLEKEFYEENNKHDRSE